MEVAQFNSYPIVINSQSSSGNIYGYQPNFSGYQYISEGYNSSWNNSDQFTILQNDSSSPATSSFYYPSQVLNNSTNSDENIQVKSTNVKNKRGRKKGTKKEKKTRSSKRSESPASPTVMKKRRLAANARERRRMNGLNVAFDR